MSRDHKVLGEAGIHLITSTANEMKRLESSRLRAIIEERVRPAPGTSELLSRPMREEVQVWNGKDVTLFDFIGGGRGEERVGGLAPVHLLGGRVDQELKKRKGKGKEKKGETS